MQTKTSGCTFEKIDLLFSVVAVGRKGKRCVHMIGNPVKANVYVSGIVIIQHAIVKPPVLVSLHG